MKCITIVSPGWVQFVYGVWCLGTLWKVRLQKATAINWNWRTNAIAPTGCQGETRLADALEAAVFVDAHAVEAHVGGRTFIMVCERGERYWARQGLWKSAFNSVVSEAVREHWPVARATYVPQTYQIRLSVCWESQIRFHNNHVKPGRSGRGDGLSLNGSSVVWFVTHQCSSSHRGWAQNQRCRCTGSFRQCWHSGRYGTWLH